MYRKHRRLKCRGVSAPDADSSVVILVFFILTGRPAYAGTSIEGQERDSAETKAQRRLAG
jgi:hypothetical protein